VLIKNRVGGKQGTPDCDDNLEKVSVGPNGSSLLSVFVKSETPSLWIVKPAKPWVVNGLLWITVDILVKSWTDSWIEPQK
jgi:hypothetical protein